VSVISDIRGRADFRFSPTGGALTDWEGGEGIDWRDSSSYNSEILRFRGAFVLFEVVKAETAAASFRSSVDRVLFETRFVGESISS
jgi:hypothetical protein